MTPERHGDRPGGDREADAERIALKALIARKQALHERRLALCDRRAELLERERAHSAKRDKVLVLLEAAGGFTVEIEALVEEADREREAIDAERARLEAEEEEAAEREAIEARLEAEEEEAAEAAHLAGLSDDEQRAEQRSIDEADASLAALQVLLEPLLDPPPIPAGAPEVDAAELAASRAKAADQHRRAGEARAELRRFAPRAFAPVSQPAVPLAVAPRRNGARARPRGAGTPRGRATSRSSSRGGDSGDDGSGSSSGDGDPPPPPGEPPDQPLAGPSSQPEGKPAQNRRGGVRGTFPTRRPA